MTTTRQLYSSPLSSNARRTLRCAGQLGEELEIVSVPNGKSAAHTAELHRFAKVVDQHLAGQHLATRQWLANDALSLADYSLAATLMHSARGQYPVQPDEHLRAHVARVRESSAWRTTEG